MRPSGLGLGLLVGALIAAPASAQQAAEPVAGESIPPVDVVQKPKAPTKKAVKKAAPAKKSAPKTVAKMAPAPAAEPAPQPPPAAEFAPAAATGTPNAAQYPSGGQGAAARAYDGALSPVDPSKCIVPGNLDKFPVPPRGSTRATSMGSGRIRRTISWSAALGSRSSTTTVLPATAASVCAGLPPGARARCSCWRTAIPSTSASTSIRRCTTSRRRIAFRAWRCCAAPRRPTVPTTTTVSSTS